MLDTYVEAGGNCIDTADVYSAGESELTLGRWIIARPGVTAPIASATSVEQVRELLGAVELQLDAEAITALNKASEWHNS